VNKKVNHLRPSKGQEATAESGLKRKMGDRKITRKKQKTKGRVLKKIKKMKKKTIQVFAQLLGELKERGQQGLTGEKKRTDTGCGGLK